MPVIQALPDERSVPGIGNRQKGAGIVREAVDNVVSQREDVQRTTPC
jgi:hypothetical protein